MTDRRREWVVEFDSVTDLEDHLHDITRDAVDSGVGQDALVAALRRVADDLEQYDADIDPRDSEPADFGGGESTGVQDL